MSILRGLFGFLLFFLFIGIASAAVMNVSYAQEGDQFLAKYLINLDKESTITLPLDREYRDLKVNGAYSIEDNNLILTGKSMSFEYSTDSVWERSNSNYYFIKNVLFADNFSEINILVKFEQGNYIEADKIYPKNYKLDTNGKDFFVSWQLKNTKAGDSFSAFVTVNSNKSNSWLYFGLVLIAIVIGIAYYHFIKNRNIDDTYLLDSEKKIINELKKANRQELWQKQLLQSTGFSKAKLSRMVRNLESRKLIKKIPIGNTNKIKLA